MPILSSAKTIFPRLAFYGLFIALLVYYLPASFVENLDILTDVGFWIYSLLLAFLIDKGITRKNTLRENVLLEVTHLRHIHHLAEAIGNKSFLTSLKSAILNYQAVIQNNFHNYLDTQKQFRALSHSIYLFRSKNEHEMVLHEDMIKTIGEVAILRQSIIHNLYKQLAPFYWMLMLATLLILMIFMLLPFAHVELKLFGLWLSLFVLYIPMEMFIRTSQNSSRTIHWFESRYQENSNELEEDHLI